MNYPQETVYVVHISDTHIGPDRAYTRHGYRSWPASQKLVEQINQLPQRPDVVIHTGDIVADPDPESYRLAAQTFAQLEVPIYYVVGNHDRATDIRHYLPMGPHQSLGNQPDLLTYRFDLKGFRFLILDARAPDELDPHGHISPEQLAIVRQEATPAGPPLVVFVHFPIWPLNSLWFDENMLILNGEELHELLRPARRRLRGVFHGHIHMPLQTTRDGILYSSTASAFANFSGWPDDPAPRFVDDPPGFSFIQLQPEQTIIRQHVFTRPVPAGA